MVNKSPLGFEEMENIQEGSREFKNPELQLEQIEFALNQAAIVAITDKKGIISFVNNKFCELSKYSKEELLGSTHSIINSGYHSKAFFEDLWMTIGKGEVWRGEIRNKTKDNTYYWTNTTIIPFLDENKKPYQYLAIRFDITKRKKLEQDLIEAKCRAEDSDHAKELFLANMSHEIRTPMNAIIGMTELLSNTSLDEKQRKYLNATSISAKNLLNIINDILDLSKVESGKLEFEITGFRIEDLFEKLINAIDYKTIPKDLYLNYGIDEKARQVLLGDPMRLNQILLNLVNNAIKFTDRGKIEIYCKVLREDKEKLLLEFSVTDTGIGIEEDKIKTIFGSFTQAEKSTTRKYGGTGLGLAICKNLIERQGGEIFVESEPGKGSIFKFNLSYLKGTEDDIESKEEKNLTPIKLGQLKILLVEDHELNQFMAISMLENWKLIVDVAENGQIALEKLKDHRYDVILMDIQMPVMGGIEATEIIRNKLKLKTPIIAITANALKGDEKKYLAAGMNDYISKPFEAELLQQKLAKATQSQYKAAIDSSIEHHKSTTKDQEPKTGKLYDLKALKELSRGDNTFVIKMINMFIEHTPVSISKINAHLANKEWDRVRAIAHKMKPSIDFMRISEVKEDIRSIEHYAEERVNLEKLPQLIRKLTEVCNEVIRSLKDEIR